MVAFRWVMGVVFALMCCISLVSFGIFLASGIELWLRRTRMFRRWAFAAALFWFNLEVWGKVVWILIHW